MLESVESYDMSDGVGPSRLACILNHVKHRDLPEHVYDVDVVLSKMPQLREDNAFHETLNRESALS